MQRSVTGVIENRIIYVLILVTIVQTLYPFTANNSQASIIVYNLLYASLMVAGTLVARENLWLTRFLIFLGVMWAVTGVVYALNQESIWVVFMTYGVFIAFESTIVQVLIRYIFAARTINRDVIFAAVAVYLLLGALFVPVYGIIETVSFSKMGEHAFVDGANPMGEDDIFPWQTFIYYSYATLTTMGYGDVLPVNMWARSAASVEAIVGVLYITIIMARLVALYTSTEVERELAEERER
ncbi:MAG: potassium channel family protein [Chloroflexi bacterium]|nr:potassium channel family protein [Chloroflexota bacterium]